MSPITINAILTITEPPIVKPCHTSPETVKLETSEAGIPRKFMGNKTFTVYGPITLGWVSEEWETEDGKPIGIGGDPSGATAEKGNQIYDSFVESILSGLKEIRKWKD